MNKVGVVLLNCNGGKFTVPCIKSLLSGTMKPDSIIVVDNASSDGSGDEIAGLFLNVRVIKNVLNVGFAAGNNIGIQVLMNEDYKYVWVLNNDTELDEDCLRAQYEFLENNSEIAGCCGKIFFSDSRNIIWYAGGLLDRMTLRVRHIGILEQDKGQYENNRETLFMTGCSMFIRGSAWRQVGLFDEKLFIYYEDLDWSLRAARLQCKLVYFPKAIIYHKVAGTMGKTVKLQTPFSTPNRVTYLMQRNYIVIIKRWKSRFVFLSIFATIEIPRAFYYSLGMLFSGRLNNLAALWKGLWDGCLF
jgi:GT2 family glycosyltransferase